jgi:hypothetical protein
MTRNPDGRFGQGSGLSRREVLGLMGATAAASLVGGVNADGAPQDDAGTAPGLAGDAGTAPPACVVRPEQTEGPTSSTSGSSASTSARTRTTTPAARSSWAHP